MSKPNILIIFGDDLGVDALRIDAAARKVRVQVDGKDVNGKDIVAAGPFDLPTFTALLKAGVHFSNAWSHPVCTPTRASLWSGLQPWKTKNLGYPPDGAVNLESPNVRGEEIKSFAQSLVDYKCAMFGKWDLGEKKTPVDWGWDTFAGILRGGLRRDGIRYYGFPAPSSRINLARLEKATNSSKCTAAADALKAKYGKTLLTDKGVKFLTNNPDLRNYIWEKDLIGAGGTRKSIGPAEREHIYITEDQVADAKNWILTNQDQRPWCVALNLVAPHDPYHVPPPGTFKTTFKVPEHPTVPEMLTAMVESVDYYLNDLLNAIGGQLANTVIITAFDNGTQDFDPDDPSVSIDGVTGDDKGTSGIGGVLVPMIVTDGGLYMGQPPCYLTTAPGAIAAPVHTMDIYATAMDIAGREPSSSIDSISFAPHLNQNVRKPTRTHNFSQMYLKPDPPGASTKGIDASVADTESKYKLSCVLLTDDKSGKPVDRSGQPTTNWVFDYRFSCLIKDANIPGSLKENQINALVVNPDGSFTVGDLAYQDKLIELYTVMAKERPYDDVNSRFPTIHKSPFVFPAEFLDTPVLIENVETKRYLFSDGAVFSGDRGVEGGWLSSPNIVGADANYYNQAYWIIRRQGEHYLIENLITKRYLFCGGESLTGARGAEGGWLASSGFASPKLVGVDADYYNRALWVFQPHDGAFLIGNLESKRYAFSDGPIISRERGAEGGWLASSGFASPMVVGADANYYNRALWLIHRP